MRNSAIILVSVIMIIFIAGCTSDLIITCDPVTHQCFDQNGNQLDIPNPEDYFPEGYALPTETTEDPQFFPPPGRYSTNALTIKITSDTEGADIYYSTDTQIFEEWITKGEDLVYQATTGSECQTIFETLNETITNNITDWRFHLGGTIFQHPDQYADSAAICMPLLDELESADMNNIESILLQISPEEIEACQLLYGIISEVVESDTSAWIDLFKDFDEQDINTCSEIFENFGSVVVEDVERMKYTSTFTISEDKSIIAVANKYGLWPSNTIIANYYLGEEISQNSPPIADFNYDSVTAEEGDTISFTSTSTDPDGATDIVSYRWYVEGALQSSEKEFTQTFPTSGTYELKLIITDSKNVQDIKIKEIQVNPVIEEPWCLESDNGPDYYVQGSISGYNDKGVILSEVTDSCCTDCDNANSVRGDYLREYYCDNNLATEEIVACINGCEDGACVAERISAHFEYSPIEPKVQDSVIFTTSELPLEEEQSKILTRTWYVDNTIVSKAQNLRQWTHVFEKSGTYNIKLVIQDEESAEEASYDVDVFVKESNNQGDLFADFTYLPEDPIVGDEIIFTSNSTGNPETYAWTIVPDITEKDAFGSTFRVVFYDPGDYEVSLRVSKNNLDVLSEKSVKVSVEDKIQNEICMTGDECDSDLICVEGICTDTCTNGALCSAGVDRYRDYGVCTFDGTENICDVQGAAENSESLDLWTSCSFTLGGKIPDESLCTTKSLSGGFTPLGKCYAGECIESSIAETCITTSECNSGELCIEGNCLTGCTDYHMRNNIKCSDQDDKEYGQDGICAYAGVDASIEEECAEVSAYDGQYYSVCGLKDASDGTICDMDAAGGFGEDGTCCGSECVSIGSKSPGDSCCQGLECNSGNCVSGTCAYPATGGGSNYNGNSGGVCNPMWECSRYGLCRPEGKQYRTCWDIRECGKTTGAPEVSQDCTYLSYASANHQSGFRSIISTPPMSYQEGGALNPTLLGPSSGDDSESEGADASGESILTGNQENGFGFDYVLLIVIVLVALGIIALVVYIARHKN